MRYFTAFLVAIGLIVLVFVIIIKSITGGGGSKSTTINLNNYASTPATAQLTIDGPINADQTHQQVQITVGNSQTTFQILSGYQGTVKTTKTFESNQASYAVFLHALSLAGFTEGNSDPNLKDERGYCPTMDRYIFELDEGADRIERYWSSECGQGNFKGDTGTVLELFQAQVPNYDDLTGDLEL